MGIKACAEAVIPRGAVDEGWTHSLKEGPKGPKPRGEKAGRVEMNGEGSEQHRSLSVEFPIIV